MNMFTGQILTFINPKVQMTENSLKYLFPNGHYILIRAIFGPCFYKLKQ